MSKKELLNWIQEVVAELEKTKHTDWTGRRKKLILEGQELIKKLKEE